MKKITRILILTLAVLQIVCCATACKREQTVSDGTQTDQAEAFELTAEKLSQYVIVYPGDAKSDMSSAVSMLNSMIEKTVGSKLEVRADSESEVELEILMGYTNRAESEEIYGNIGICDNGFAMVGKKVLIIGKTADKVSDAALIFKADILDKGGNNGVLMKDGDRSIFRDSEGNERGEWLEKSKESYYASILEGLTINALGDSYFAGDGIEKDQVWLSLLAEKYGINMNNYGKGGSTVSNYETTRNPMCDRYVSMANNNPDIVLFEGGRNDFNREGLSVGEVDSYDTKTFAGGLNVTIEGLKAKYPNAMIVCISNWNFPDTKYGHDYTDFAYMMKAVAERQGVYFIEACDPKISGIDMSDKLFRLKYCIKESDVSHLNYAGMKIAMSYFEKVLAEYYQDFLSKK